MGTREQLAVTDDCVAIPKRLTGSNFILNVEWDATHLETRTIW